VGLDSQGTWETSARAEARQQKEREDAVRSEKRRAMAAMARVGRSLGAPKEDILHVFTVMGCIDEL
jgi:hypothetical protein